MTNSTINRRSFLIGVTAVGVGGAIVPATAASAGRGGTKGPKGKPTTTTSTSTTTTSTTSTSTTTTTAPPASGGAGRWDDPASWADGRVPGPGDIAIVDRHIIAAGAVSVGGIRIEPTGVLEFDPDRSSTVESSGNVVNTGRLVMRPSADAIVHRLRFVNVDESAFVGDGMAVLDSDVGLWTIKGGVVDAQGTERAGWNRTGDDPTWLDTDELVRAPNAPGDFTTFAPHRKGAAVPSVTGPRGPVYTEVLNLTRNVWIEGTPTGRAHMMFMMCMKPQTIRHIGVRYMGPRQDTADTYRSGSSTVPVTAGVIGRYGMHFHHCGDGTRGSLIEGVVVRDGGFRAFVPHASHGMTFRDCIAYDVFDDGYWWDPEGVTNDLVYDHCAAMMVRSDPDFRGYETTGFLLGEGINMTARDCVAVGVRSKAVNAGGFHWPSKANHDDNVWTFEDCVAHNNRDAGFAVWQNDDNPHVIVRSLAYHNGVGINHGAYINTYLYSDGYTFANGTELIQHALGATYERMEFHGDIQIVKHAQAFTDPTRYVDCLITGTVIVDESRNPGVFVFESTDPRRDLARAKFDVRSLLSEITVRNSDGSSFVVS